MLGFNYVSDSDLESAEDMRRGKRRHKKETGVGIDPEFLSRSIARLVESTMDRLVQTKYSEQFSIRNNKQ